MTVPGVSTPIIDTHVHIWPSGTTAPKVASPYAGSADADYLVAEMDRVGIAGAVLITPRAMGTDNSYALAAMRAHPGRYLGVVGVVDYTQPEAEGPRIRREAEAGQLSGIRLHPCFDPDLDLRAPALATIWDACARNGLSVCIHADPAQYDQLEELAAAWPGVTILIDHMGRFPLGQGPNSPSYRKLLGLCRYPGVHLKLSSIPWLLRESAAWEAVDPFFGPALEAFGPERLLWGADWPVLVGVGWTYADAVTQALRMELPDEVKGAVLGGNAQRIYRLPR